MKKLFILFLAFYVNHALADGDPSLEDLLDTGLLNPSRNVDASTASKFSQRIQKAPSAVRVLSHDDIAEYGYRTLGEILRSLPGLDTSYDYVNTFLGARGVAIPGDYNTRVLILIDGIRLNNNVFDSALVGNEFPLDVDLIDRVEYAAGPGSAIYGNNAFFGVVNILTRGASSLRGTEASLEYGSFNTHKLRASVAKRLDNGAEYLLSASQFYRGGPSTTAYMDYSVVAPDFKGSAAIDDEINNNIFAKFSIGGLQLTGVFSNREKGNPVLMNFTNDQLLIMNGKSVASSQHAFVGMSYEFSLFNDWNFQTRLNYHEEEYQGSNPFYFDPTSMFIAKEDAIGRWWDGEFQVVNNRLEGHKILLGVEGRLNVEQSWRSYIEGWDSQVNRQQSSQRFAAFTQDEISINDQLTFIAGARLDYTEFGSNVNPRLGLIWNPQDKTNFKLLYGSAFRNPNFFEQTQNEANFFHVANAEKINTIELAAEHYFSPSTKFNSSLYHYRMSDLIGQANYETGLVYLNLEEIKSIGWETELEQRFKNGLQAKLAYSLQRTTIAGHEVFNSPRHMLNFKFSVPLFDSHWKLASELRYLSGREIFFGHLDPQWLGDMSLNGELNKNFSISLTAHNIGDVSYREATRIANYDSFSAKQDGRDIRLKLNVRY
ncbi:TonB-dependent receptor [Iodobacter sp. CM08]|uniref:TonB-dependent receptor plug domain-containing protein n=1 Tax=Iodobacter sp. CM08 TaxID=3085902 RepID=UPI002981E338|nr:TonB-dependent receptor [Iodobacter sp. CM08]MDW5415218.1 TonB-dependent receptor [Iodobacter sp. CM08]